MEDTVKESELIRRTIQMYNPQLETFIRVADAGSFNKAAEESYITPTAVIMRIGNSECLSKC